MIRTKVAYTYNNDLRFVIQRVITQLAHELREVGAGILLNFFFAITQVRSLPRFLGADWETSFDTSFRHFYKYHGYPRGGTLLTHLPRLRGIPPSEQK